MATAQTQSGLLVRYAPHPAVRKALAVAINSARSGAGDSGMTHSWLFTGPPGAGRSTAAIGLAAGLLCTGATPACGQCHSCREVLAGTHPDLVHLKPETLSIGVDTVRELNRQANMAPSHGKWRCIIMEDADRLTESAANALLKTVEEPPASTVILMCAPSTDPQDFSVTLRSRCRHVYVPAPTTAQVAQLLLEESGQVGSEQATQLAHLAASAAAGHIGRARHLLISQTAQARRARALGIIAGFNQGNRPYREISVLLKQLDADASVELAQVEEQEEAALKRVVGADMKGRGTAAAQAQARRELTNLEKTQKTRRSRYVRDLVDLCLVDMAGLLRDALMIAAGAQQIPAIHQDFAQAAAFLAEMLGERGLVAALDAVTQCRERIQKNVKAATALDGLLGQLKLLAAR